MIVVIVTYRHKLTQQGTSTHLHATLEITQFTHEYKHTNDEKIYPDRLLPLGCLYVYYKQIVRRKLKVEHQIKPIDWYELC